MELLKTHQYYVLLNGEHSLWCDRKTGAFEAKPGWELANGQDPECLGIFYGLIGRIRLADCDDRLLLIKECATVGTLPSGHVVNAITSIAILQPTAQGVNDIGLKPCRKHHKQQLDLLAASSQKAAIAKTWGSIKSATSSIKTSSTQHGFMQSSSKTGFSLRKETKEKEKFEKRIVDELFRIFTGTDSFYYCPNGGDLTNSVQKQYYNSDREPNAFSWRLVDDRFFWNKHMLQDLILTNDPQMDPWIIPIIQGFVQIETVHLDCKKEAFSLTIISRRSRFRAGTRYKRRGLDESGRCANYVETEQIVCYKHHCVSFVQVRGSVPLYWSQPGYKYRPPPRLHRTKAETHEAFEKHFNEELALYGPVAIINLVEQTGKESVIFDAYTEHVIMFNNTDITYVTFDFHEFCRGMKFENVTVLIHHLEKEGVLNQIGYCWRDKHGLIKPQTGIIRTNCIDCLDRTNIVQTALAKVVITSQLTKLGLVSPEGTFPDNLKTIFQLIWANNGDHISKQYAGTNALKGDYTRTGERKFSGLMKDGMNSANRYYLSRFKDTWRQATIDIMLGNPVEEPVTGAKEASEDFEDEVDGDESMNAEHVKLLIEDCKKLLISDQNHVRGAWGLINASEITDLSESEMDTVLILTQDSYYVADYDDQMDKISKYQRVPLEDIVVIETGPLSFGNAVASGPLQLFKQSTQKQPASVHCLRIQYNIGNGQMYYHTFRSTNIRFFNNVTSIIKSPEEMIESFNIIADTIVQTAAAIGLEIQWKEGPLDPAPLSKESMSRNSSETQLSSLKNVGAKALTSMSQGFSKLNRLGQSFKSRTKPKVEMSPSKLSNTAESAEISSEEEELASDAKLEAVSNIGRSSGGKEPLHRVDFYLPSVGLLISCQQIHFIQPKESSVSESVVTVGLSKVCDQNKVHGKYPFLHSRTDLVLNVGPAHSSVSKAPDIVISSTCDKSDLVDSSYMNSLFSRSSEVLSLNQGTSVSSSSVLSKKDSSIVRSSSEKDLVMNIKQSHSETTLRNLKFSFSSVASTAISIPSSPFSRFARGVQSLSSNLDPRKLKASTQEKVSPVLSPDEVVQNQVLIEKWVRHNCRSKLIAL
nr:PREDICTED: phosphatidylinositide phosphatase SAC2 isoform X3 [Bemisia tabaci]